MCFQFMFFNYKLVDGDLNQLFLFSLWNVDTVKLKLLQTESRGEDSK